MHAIRLEALDQRHQRDVHALVADPEILRYTRIPEPPPEGFARDWIAGYETRRRDGTRDGFAAIAGAGDSSASVWRPTSRRPTARSSWVTS
jgi:hypothetical protein